MSAILKVARQLNRATLVEILLLSAAAAVLEVVSVWVLRMLFLLMLGSRSGVAASLSRLLPFAVQGKALDSPLPLLAGVFLFIILKNVILAILWRMAFLRLAREQTEFARRLFENYLRAPYATHVAHSQAVRQHNLSVIANQMFPQLVVPTLLTFSESLVLLAIAGYLLVVSPIVTILLGAWLCIVLFAFRAMTSRAAHESGVLWRDSAAKMLRLARESFGDFKSIKLLARESFFIDLFRSAAAHHSVALAEDRFRQQTPRYVLEPALIGGIIVLYAILVYRHTGSGGMLSELSLYAAAATRILPASQRIIGQIPLLAFHRADFDAVFPDLQHAPRVEPERLSTDLEAAFATSILFQDVSLKYEAGDHPALHGISLDIRRGDKICIVGASGSGKTSFLNVLLGLLSPTTGQVLIDGRPAPLLERFRHTTLAFVPQDVFLLDGSIAANIAFGMLEGDADTQHLWDALRLAEFDNQVRAMPDGLRSRVGENGIALSGGERQRLALARSFYQRPSLLVLDEATSQLDPATEAAILENMFAAFSDTTVVMVTHRVSNIGRFSRCFRVVAGRLAEVDGLPEEKDARLQTGE